MSILDNLFKKKRRGIIKFNGSQKYWHKYAGAYEETYKEQATIKELEQKVIWLELKLHLLREHL